MPETVANMITSARYDLRDENLLQLTDVKMLNLFNRALVQLDNALSSLESDWVHDEDTSTTLSAAANSAARPTGAIVIRDIWIGTDQLKKKDYKTIFYKRKWRTGTGEPDYFAEHGSNIIFEYTADQDYTLTIYYDKRATALTLVGNMPYDSEFDQALREGVVILAKRRNEYDVNLDAVLHDFFLGACLGNAMKKQFKPRYYRLGF